MTRRFFLVVSMLTGIMGMITAQPQTNASRTSIGLRGGTTYSLYEAPNAYYPSHFGYLAGVGYEFRSRHKESWNLGFLLHVSYATYTRTNIDSDFNWLGWPNPKIEDHAYHEARIGISSISIAPSFVVQIGSTNLEFFAGLSADAVVSTNETALIRMDPIAYQEYREVCPTCTYLNDGTMLLSTGELAATGFNGIQRGCVIGLQYVYTIDSIEIVPALAYRQTIDKIGSPYSAVLRAIEASASVRLRL
ncbi:MAG: hypothetical protein H7X70_04000 [Candidatus Kapabacteria bacterium]|nr:hypothetical protein [Candidatus Kapabacteria bacterium]